MDASPPRTIHYTQLPEPSANSKIALEWNTYRREVGRLLAEGREGQFVLIKGDQILDFFDTWEAADAEGYRRFLLSGFVIQPIRTYEPLLRIRSFA